MNILVSLRFFYVYYFKKYKRTFDIDFYIKKYNVPQFFDELDGFFQNLLGQQHLSIDDNIQSIGCSRPPLIISQGTSMNAYKECDILHTL
ncbi:hypothetical protein COR24_17515 [Vibrio cholerae]|nr:hypothetical protein [Vibrio cholerae]EGR5456670.1 hypothetical protein [Vibrio cholerae]EGR5464302.1 hypothetical protein [Vibrio cholerae]